MFHESSEAGLTLIELMMGLAVAAIVMLLGFPGFQSLIASVQRTSVVTELSTSLLYARSEAVSAALAVSLCPSADGQACLSASRPQWNQGWIVFQDHNADLRRNGDERLLRVHDFANPLFSLLGKAGLERGGGFHPSGFARTAGRLEYCEFHAAEGFSIELKPAGRIRVIDGLACNLN